jgi:hypothetical protein
MRFTQLLFTVLGLLLALSVQTVYSQQRIEQHEVFELELKHKVEASGKPYADVSLSAEFTHGTRTLCVEGFYDGDDTYRIRLMPDEVGEWHYVVSANVKALNGMRGSVHCVPNTQGNKGMVKVRDTFHFGHADGTPFYPLGTTCYGWVWQGDDLVNQTLDTLKGTAFNKVRMTVLPKHYSVYINNDPPFFPFEGSAKGGWDFSRFNPEYFRYLETQIERLGDLGIQADLILFHPYDYGKWNLNAMPPEAAVNYLRYLVARLAAYHNVWWSMANEYDMMHKPQEEWDLYFKTVQAHDPYGHLMGMHNGQKMYDHTKPWITHLSVQAHDLFHIQDWRESYEKPVVMDEVVYEGNIPTDWGNLTPQEMVNRFWICWTRGAYCTHGETYEHPNNILWWSKGGKLYGKSPERLAFLKRIMEDAPATGLIPFHDDWNKKTYLFTEDRSYFLHYYQNHQQASAKLRLPDDKRFKVDVIDAWNMTVVPQEGVFSGEVLVPLPQRPYMAVRATAIE